MLWLKLIHVSRRAQETWSRISWRNWESQNNTQYLAWNLFFGKTMEACSFSVLFVTSKISKTNLSPSQYPLALTPAKIFDWSSSVHIKPYNIFIPLIYECVYYYFHCTYSLFEKKRLYEFEFFIALGLLCLIYIYMADSVWQSPVLNIIRAMHHNWSGMRPYIC